MKKTEEIKKIADFLKTAHDYFVKDGEGCYYREIGDQGLCIVVGNTGNEILAKIAYNCDDLQSDYDYDWYYPAYKKNNACAEVEFEVKEENYKEDAEYLFFEALKMNKEIKKGNMILGDAEEEN